MPSTEVAPGAGAPLVTAIIIFLDGAAFIGEAIESVLSQDHPALELLLVDDGSSDGASEIAARAAEAHPQRVFLLQHPGGVNRGMSASRNLGLSRARGKFIAFLDADDLWLPGKIAAQAAILERGPALGLVYGRTLLWHSWDPAQAGMADDFCPLGVEPDRAYPAQALLANLLHNRFQTPTTCNAMMRRAACEAVGGFDEAFRGMYEDQAFFMKLYLRYPLWVSSACWAQYRQHLRPQPPFSRESYFRERRQLLEHAWREARPFLRKLDERTRARLRLERWQSRHPALAASLGPTTEADLNRCLAATRAARTQRHRG